MSENKTVWVAGHYLTETGPEEWALIGVFETEGEADSACKTPWSFYFSVKMGAVCPESEIVEMDVIYPRVDYL